ncbi:MAG: hypothetical protein D6805_01380 [Planctomycetota bacterium]|nr:MAG: hypothetical protein D6805_01380 [Planctomycetota bacterium]
MSQRYNPKSVYQERLFSFRQRFQHLEGVASRLSRWRLFSFCIFLAGVGVDLFIFFSWIGTILGVGGLILFLFLVFRHQRLRERLYFFRSMVEVNQEAIYRLERDWSKLPSRLFPPSSQGEGCLYAEDLNLYGYGSIYHLLNLPVSYDGQRILGEWISQRASLEEIQLRQRAVEELMPCLDFRQSIYAHAKRISSKDLGKVLGIWERVGDFYSGLRWVWFFVVILSGVGMGVCLLADILGLLWGRLWLIFLLFHFGISSYFSQDFQKRFQMFSRVMGDFATFVCIWREVVGLEWRSDLLKGVRRDFELALERRSGGINLLLLFLEARNAAIVQLPFQLLFLWDFYLLFWVEVYRRRLFPFYREVLQQLGRLEVLVAFASFGWDEPKRCFPSLISSPPYRFLARGIGHPLLARERRVDNDISLDSLGKFLLITGSNMSGKSTLLRALGVGVVLAQAGAPVAAEEFVAPLVELVTSIQVRDDLREGLSYFMSEVYRIKTAVELVESSEEVVFFLFDEIFQGTNSEERRIAAVEIVRYLLRKGAMGILTTHDLTLAKSGLWRDAAVPYYFTESVSEDGQIFFDYILREGFSPSRNALRLIRMVGIPLEGVE